MKAKTEKEKQAQKDYLVFLEKRVNSENYKNSVTKEEYEKIVAKFKKERLKIKLGL